MTRAALVVTFALLAAAPAEAALRVQTVARGIPNPANIAFDARGGMWVTSSGYQAKAADGVWYVPRRGARPRQVIARLFAALGLTWHRNTLYVAHVTPYATFARGHTGVVAAYSGFDGTRFRSRRVILSGIPTGLHRLTSIVPGPGGRLYLGIGSRGDARAGGGLSSSIVSFRPGGGGLRVEARGLRNPYGLGFLPGTSTLFVSDNGRDDLGLHSPPEELNVFDVRSRVPHFGFPQCWGRRGGRCDGTRRPLVELAPHSATGGVAVTRRFGSWGPTAFVTEYGSSFDSKPTGGTLVRVALRRERGVWRGRASTVRRLGRQNPLGAAIGPRGALYVTLWESGKVVRFTPPRARASCPRALWPSGTGRFRHTGRFSCARARSAHWLTSDPDPLGFLYSLLKRLLTP